MSYKALLHRVMLDSMVTITLFLVTTTITMVIIIIIIIIVTVAMSKVSLVCFWRKRNVDKNIWQF